MSLADRYPRLRRRQLPEWVVNNTDDDSDLVQAARRSFVGAIQDVTSNARFPIHLDLRLIGPSTEGGRLPSDVLQVADRFKVRCERRSAQQRQPVSQTLIGSVSARAARSCIWCPVLLP